MKKQIAILMALALALSMTACRRKANTNTTTDTNQQTALTGTMGENVNKLIQAEPVEFMGGMLPVDLKDTSEEGLWQLKSTTGLDSAEKITDVAVYEPMTGSQAFSLVLVRVAEGNDPKDVAQQMKENIDPNKWICARADQVSVAGYGDTVLFVMADSNLDVETEDYVEAFKTLCGGKLDFTM